LILQKLKTIHTYSKMIKIYIFLLLATLLCINADQNVQFIDYGKYCGLGHTQTDGSQPIDELDRFCQIHDICVTAGGMISGLGCFCNEQLYYHVSNYNPIDSIASKEKNGILSFIYAAISLCDNYAPLKNTYLLASYDEKNYGFWFIPFYESFYKNLFKNVSFDISADDDLWYYLTSKTENITQDTIDESNINIIKKGTTKNINPEQKTLVLVNKNQDKSIGITVTPKPIYCLEIYTTTSYTTTTEHTTHAESTWPAITCSENKDDKSNVYIIIISIVSALFVGSVVFILVYIFRKKSTYKKVNEIELKVTENN
jgi:hypothetical protein